MKLEHFGMAEPGDCRLVFTADAEELERAITAEQAAPDAPQAEEDLLMAAVNRTILEGFSALYEQIAAEYGVTPVTDPDFELLAVNRAEGFRAGAVLCPAAADAGPVHRFCAGGRAAPHPAAYH